MAKRQLVITLFSIFGFTMLTIGSAYAVFTSVSKQENYNIVKVGTLEINFGEDANDVINLNGKLPETDEEGLGEKPYTFTIKNEGTVRAEYQIKLEEDKDMIESEGCGSNQLNKSYIKYALEKNKIEEMSKI